MRTLSLVSPNLNGPDVVKAQTLLATNPYGIFYSDKPDGDFGSLTAQACYRAKYWLGYSTASCKQTFGGQLASYLSGTRPLGKVMQARRNERLQAKQNEPLRVKAYKSALTQLGVKEEPANSNDVLYSQWYGLVGSPWCAMFVSWNYVGVGSTTFKKGVEYAYVPYIVNDARAGRNNLTLTTNPQQGDLVCYDWPGESPGLADHVGLFGEWINQGAGNFSAVEGNTSLGNNSNGGEVQNRTDRYTVDVQVFVHVGA